MTKDLPPTLAPSAGPTVFAVSAVPFLVVAVVMVAMQHEYGDTACGSLAIWNDRTERCAMFRWRQAVLFGVFGFAAAYCFVRAYRARGRSSWSS